MSSNENLANTYAEIDAWLNEWQADPLKAKEALLLFYQELKAQEQVIFEFKARPSISYSLRAIHKDQQTRPLFALIDVVDDDPAERWLSVCFYADMVNDPDELGDFVPQGLMGQDALCLNLEEDDENMRNYIQARLGEALAAASKF